MKSIRYNISIALITALFLGVTVARAEYENVYTYQGGVFAGPESWSGSAVTSPGAPHTVSGSGGGLNASVYLSPYSTPFSIMLQQDSGVFGTAPQDRIPMTYNYTIGDKSLSFTAAECRITITGIQKSGADWIGTGSYYWYYQEPSGASRSGTVSMGTINMGSSGYLSIEANHGELVTTELSIDYSSLVPSETWAPFDEMTRDWYDVTGWTPDPSTVPAGQVFTQSKTQQQDWRRGERSNVGNERNVVAYTVSRTLTQSATGTRPKQVPVITWAAPVAVTYGTRLSPVQLNATANTSGVFSYAPAENVTLNAGENQTLSVIFTPDDTETFTAATATQTITVNKAPTVLTITSPTASPHTLPVDSTATISTSLRRGSTALSTASVTLSKGATTGTATGTLALNVFTMNAGAGNDTITVNASYPGDNNHLPASASVVFRVPVPGSVIFGYPAPVASPVTLPDAFLFAEHGPTSSTFDFALHNPGELPVQVASADIAPALGSVPTFQIVDANGGDAAAPFTISAGATKALKLRFRPVRYALNSDTIRFTWQCRPSATVLAFGSTEWTLRGQGLKPIMATMPKGSVGDPNNPRDLKGTWPTLRSQ